MNPINKPHHQFFRKSMEEIAIVRDFIKAHLQAEFYAQLDLESLQITDRSYIPEELSDVLSDVVYTCQIKGKPAYIPLLLLTESESKENLHMAFRMLQYKLNVMQDHLNAGHSKLPVVLPLVMYHGKTAYPYSHDLSDDFEDPELAKKFAFKPLLTNPNDTP